MSGRDVARAALRQPQRKQGGQQLSYRPRTPKVKQIPARPRVPERLNLPGMVGVQGLG